MSFDIKIKVNQYNEKYMVIDNYALYEYGEFTTYAKEGLVIFLKREKAHIDLALEQLKDIEKMSEEL